MPTDPLENYRTLLNAEPKLGDKFVIVDSKWFEHWQRFVGLKAKEDDKDETDPGPIDFTNLTEKDQDKALDEIQLRADAVENNDFVFIPHKLYEELSKINQPVGKPIVRSAIPRTEFDIVIETFLVPLRLRESKENSTKDKQIYLSRRTKISHLQAYFSKEFGKLMGGGHRLYTSTDTEGTQWRLIDDDQSKTLEDIDLLKNAYITYDSKPSSARTNYSYQSTSRYTRGLCGLSNLGNTCFMNSALQCISNVPIITHYFLENEYKQHINRDNPLGMKGDIAKAYGDLMHEMWSGTTNFYAPTVLKRSVALYAPQFSGYAQQDSQEFMSFLLDGLHEDLNQVKNKPYIEKKDDDGKSADKILADEQWEDFRKRNLSKIHDTFLGQIKSVVQCLTCGTSARTFDPICFLSLPLPGKAKVRTFKIDYVRLNGQIKTYQVKLDEQGRVRDLVQAFCNRFQPQNNNEKSDKMDTEPGSATNQPNGVVENKDGKNGDQKEEVEENEEEEEEEQEKEEDFTKAPDYDGHQPKPDLILPTEVYNHRIHIQFVDNTYLTSILERDQIVFYETPDRIKKGSSETILMPCVFRETDYYRGNFGYPIYITVPRNDCKGKDIEDALKKTIGKFLPLSPDDSSDKLSYNVSITLNHNYHQQTVPLSSILEKHVDFARTGASLIIDVSQPIVEKYKKQQEEKSPEKNQSSSTFNSSIDYRRDTQSGQKKTTTLMKCFRYFTKKETLSDDDLWMCPKCKILKKATKKIDIWRLPKVLIVQLKRFNYTRYFRDKIDLFVDCPLDNLDLSQFVKNPAEKNKTKYELIAVSNHMGGLGGGHYTAYAKNDEDKKWHSFDDSYVSNMSENDVISKAAYVLIYQQK